MKIDYRYAIEKIQDFFGLHTTKKRISRHIDYVCENPPDMIRMFKDSCGHILQMYISSSQSRMSPFGIGHWTFFKNDDKATFELFTQTMKSFMMQGKDRTTRSVEIENPFYGCSCIEEVLVTYDLLKCIK